LLMLPVYIVANAIYAVFAVEVTVLAVIQLLNQIAIERAGVQVLLSPSPSPSNTVVSQPSRVGELHRQLRHVQLCMSLLILGSAVDPMTVNGLFARLSALN